MMKLLTFLALALATAYLALATQTAGPLVRLPFQKKEITLKSPATYEQRVLLTSSKTGEPVYYDPKPRVVPLDVKAGKYALRWIGYDGKEKTGSIGFSVGKNRLFHGKKAVSIFSFIYSSSRYP